MKRLIVRISILAGLVVVGLIAIAQAQRNGDPPPPKLPPDFNMAAEGERALAEHRPETSEARPSPPQLMPLGLRANPLRPESEPETAAAAPPAGEAVYPTAAQEPVRENRPASPARPNGPTAQQSPFDLTPPGLSPAAPSTNAPPAAPEMQPPPFVAPNLVPVAADSPPGPPTTTPAPQSEPLPLNGNEPPRPSPTAPPMMPTSAAPVEPAPLRNAPPSSEGAPGALGGMIDASPLAEGKGTPGSTQLEGPQTPQVSIEKFAPPEIQVGAPATFRVKVQNVGQVAARAVEVHDLVPQGTRLVTTNPRASQGPQGELVWVLGTMKPGESVTVEMEVMPIEEGEIGSVASVVLQAEASVRTVATKPELVVKASGPAQVLIGEEVTLSITVSNPGSGVAAGVSLVEQVPPGLVHEAGNELEYEVGDLKPKESRQIDLQLKAAQAGPTTNVLIAQAEGNLRVEDRVDIEVLAPQLDVAVQGPARRYLEREATYVVSVSNPGTAPAHNVELVAELPPGLQFVSANNSGQFNQATRTVSWQLQELPVRETGAVQLVTMPIEPGEHTLRVSGTSERGVSDKLEQPVVVEGVEAILFQVVDVEDPIAKGSETAYEIRVVNQGTKAATNVQVVALLPSEMRAVSAEGPVRYATEPGRIVFEPLSRLAPKADTTYRVRVQGLEAGDLRIRVQITTDEIRTPVTKEESTRVYAD
jgi:uncharacterized repeat protein (TIGR01451 family)